MKSILLKFILLLSSVCLSFGLQAHSSSEHHDKSTVKKLLFISAAHSNKAKVRLLQTVAKDNTAAHWQIHHQPAKSLPQASALIQLINAHDVVVFDAVSAREAAKTYDVLNNPLATASVSAKRIAFHYLSNPVLNDGLNSAQQNNLQAYWQNAGRANLNQMLNFIALDILALKNDNQLTLAQPIVFPPRGIYHPKQANLIARDLASYQTWSAPKDNQPKVALLLQRALIETESTQLIDATIAQLEAKGAYVVPFFFELSPRSGDYSDLLQLPIQKKQGDTTGKSTEVDLIVNFRNIHWANKRKIEFEQFAVPVMQAMTYYAGDQKAWEADKQGISAGMMAFTLVLPESAGVTDPFMVAAMDRETQQLEIIDYQLEHLVNKALNVVNLKYKANADKKLTVFVWGDQDMGASFMNIPASLESISQRLANEGYQTNARNAAYFTDNAKHILNPFYRDFELKKLLDADLAELMPIKDYLAWFNSLPPAVTQPINAHWGAPKDNFMAVEKDGEHFFILPRIRNGNMLIMRQPPRSDNKNDENHIYHQGIVPINHFYLAAYYYARQYWQSDAIVHLGTHGSQEYLGGKERGLSIYDQGNLAVWDTPVVYPFIVDDVGEAMQTKRRGRATVISHMTPPFAAAGLHGDLSNLHELMHQYKQLDDGGVKQKTAEQIVEQCITNNLCKDIGWQQDRINNDFDGFMQALHNHMEALASAHQPLGLHTYGYLAEDDLVISTLVQMLGPDFSKMAGTFEHEYYLKNHHEHNHNDEADQDHSHNFHGVGHEHAENSTDPNDPNNGNNAHTQKSDLDKQIALQNLAGFRTLKNYVLLNASQANRPIALDKMTIDLQAQINRAKTLYNNMANIRELQSMVDFLSAKYIPVKTGGDPIRHPDSLPTGYNLYGFDPSRVPTKAAFEQGKELVEQMIANYQQKHQTYPDKMAFSLWSIETMRHYGVLESQALYAMGVTPKWSPDGRVIGTEVIPYQDLKRPRVDVVLSATGLYRDAFPSVMQMLAGAVNQVAQLKADNNSMWKNHVADNAQRIKAALISQGVTEEEATYLSTIRLFSNQSGDYGSGVDDATWASDTWQTDKKIADNYLAKMGYFFGADSTRWGEKAENANGDDVQLYAKQLSGTDIAMFARSSNLFGMLSTDDPFEYFGALSLAVRNIDGKSPDMVVANLRDANQAKAEDAALFMAKELRTRMFHPRWIKELQKEGYSGAVSMASKVDNFFGWQVVDPNLVRNDQWDEFMDVYINDKYQMQLDEWFEQINPAALANMMERMLEAERKDYWQVDEVRLKTLVDRYIDIVNKHQLIVMNDALRKNVEQLAAGFGLQPLDNAKTMADMAKQAAAQKAANQQALTTTSKAESESESESEKVAGQKLAKQSSEASHTEPNYFIYQALFLMILIMATGGAVQVRKTKKSNLKIVA